MRVLRIIPVMNPSSGGPCQGIRNIVPELEKLGIHNEVVCLDDPREEFLKKDNFSITALGPAKGPWAFNANLVPWLQENLGRFDVVIIHALWLYHGYGFMKALKLYKKQLADQGKDIVIPRYFVMPHGMLDPYFQYAPERKIKAIRNWIYWKLIERKLINNADGVLFTCMSELLLARIPFRPYHPRKELNIGYGVQSPPPFANSMAESFLEKCPQVKNHSFILFLSRIHDKKGVDLLINAYLKIHEKSQADKNFPPNRQSVPKLVIAGPGLETEYGKRMQQLVVNDEKLRDSVLFPGMLSGDAKWGAFYLSEAFILPSHQENFGIAVVESLACGKPVLISNKVNIWQEISDLNAGIISDDTLEGTIKLLENYLLTTKEKKIEMGKQARLTYKKKFDVVEMAQQWVNVISQVI